MICFPPPLNLCFPASYGQPLPQALEDGEELTALFSDED